MEKLKVAVYIRVANKETTKEDSAIELQKIKVNDYLKKNVKGIEFKDYYIDNGFSGRTYNRPEFKRMFTDIRNKKINMVIVTDLVRFGRTNNTLERIEALKRKYNVDFISITDGFDTINKKEESEQMIMLHNIMNEAYKADIRAKRRFAKERMKG